MVQSIITISSEIFTFFFRLVTCFSHLTKVNTRNLVKQIPLTPAAGGTHWGRIFSVNPFEFESACSFTNFFRNILFPNFKVSQNVAKSRAVKSSNANLVKILSQCVAKLPFKKSMLLCSIIRSYLLSRRCHFCLISSHFFMAWT